MGKIIFEVGFFFAGVVIYFVIGSYYRFLYGFLLATISVFLYVAGLILGFGLIVRLLLQAIPFAVMILRTPSINIKIEKDKKICPKCGYLNDQNADFCTAPRCDADLRVYNDYSKISYYFPPKVIAGIIMGFVALSLLYDNTILGKYIVSVLYGAWPAVALLVFIIVVFYMLR